MILPPTVHALVRVPCPPVLPREERPTIPPRRENMRERKELMAVDHSLSAARRARTWREYIRALDIGLDWWLS